MASLQSYVRRRDIYARQDLMVNGTIKQIYTSGSVTGADGEQIKFTSGVGPAEGFHMYTQVKNLGATKTLEIGCANGMSTLYIAQALRDLGGSDRMHTAIDPFQTTQWRDVGQLNIKRAGLSELVEIIRRPSYLAMPELVAANPAAFDFILIDGMHLFDYTLVDLFYATMLVKQDGIICLDDIRHDGVKKAHEYILANYPHLQLIDTPGSTLAIYRKIADDTRAWNFHRAF